MAYLAATIGVPLPLASVKDLSQPFPCMNRPCGCLGAVTGGAVPSNLDPTAVEAPSALVLSHAGPHLPNNPDVTDADATSSFHVSGVNFVFGDGSVHIINSDIDMRIYDALATRAGKEPVTGDNF